MSSSAARSLRVLDAIARSDRPIGVTEIARSLSLSPASVFRSLDALLRTGLIARFRESSRYVTGAAAERLRRSVIARFPLREICLPYLRQLASISGETVSLHVRVGWYAVRICSVPGTSEVTSLPLLRRPAALGESSAGQAILAHLPKAQIAAYRKWASKPAKRGAQPDSMAFPLRANGQTIAAITIEAPTPLQPEQAKQCAQVIANVEGLAAAQPMLFATPFDHLDPNAISL